MQATALLGVTTPRLYTRPLVEGAPGECGCGCALTPETSLGFACVRFALEVLGLTLDDWQRWFLIHALETRPDGSFRFRRVLLLVARQNGKTTVMRVLTLWAIWTGRVKLAIGTAQDLDIARECWAEAADVALSTMLADDLDGKPRRANGQEEIKFRNGGRYKIKATTEDAARGIPGVGLLLADELRTHRTYAAWGAMSKTTMAQANALIVGMSNAGDDSSIVLNDLRAKALAGGSSTMGIFEWSAVDGCALDDRAGWAQANPSLGYGRLTEEALLDSMENDPPNIFRTECLCQRVESLESAVSKAGWDGGADGEPGMLRGRGDVAAVWDVAPDGQHVTLVVAGREGDRVRVEVAGAWDSTAAARVALPGLLDKIKARHEGWFPSGPAGALAPVMKGRRRVTEVSAAESAKACMGLAELAKTSSVLHPNDPLLDAHVLGASWLKVVDGTRFHRLNGGHCDAAYAAAGAVHLVLMDRHHDWSALNDSE